jgi:hypothetical protein
MAAFWSFGYARKFAEPGVRSLMRQADEPLVMAGALFRPIRGLPFGLVFYLLREPCSRRLRRLRLTGSHSGRT